MKRSMGMMAGALAALAQMTPLAASAQVAEPPKAVRPDQLAFRDLYKELIETNTTLSAGSCTAAAEAMGVTMAGAPPLGVLENTPTRHHLVVCTLCSCYPRAVLGYPPNWYKSFAYRSRAVREPRAVLAEWGLNLPDSVEVRVVDSTADYRWMVLPMRPAGTEGWDEARLASLVTRDALVGVAVAKPA